VTDIQSAQELLSQKKYCAVIVTLAFTDNNNIAFVQELYSLSKTQSLSIIITGQCEKKIATAELTRIADSIHTKEINMHNLQSALQLICHYQKQSIILHVEDDADIVQLVKNVLEHYGENNIKYYSVASLAEARSFLTHHQVDLVILDLVLPDGSGADLLSQIPEICKVIIFSGYNTKHIISRNVSAVLIKSITNNEQLLKTIKHVLMKHNPTPLQVK
jgi:DNA-binding NtrC family response regulator